MDFFAFGCFLELDMENFAIPNPIQAFLILCLLSISIRWLFQHWCQIWGGWPLSWFWISIAQKIKFAFFVLHFYEMLYFCPSSSNQPYLSLTFETTSSLKCANISSTSYCMPLEIGLPSCLIYKIKIPIPAISPSSQATLPYASNFSSVQNILLQDWERSRRVVYHKLWISYSQDSGVGADVSKFITPLTPLFDEYSTRLAKLRWMICSSAFLVHAARKQKFEPLRNANTSRDGLSCLQIIIAK